MTIQMIRSINESSMPTTLSDYELFDDSKYQTGTTNCDSAPLFIVVQPTVARKNPPKMGHRLKDVLKEVASDSVAALELKEARRRVGEVVYASESGSLQSLRLNLGLSQTELANLAQTTQARISKIENGDESPRYDTMKRLANALRIDMNALASALDYASARQS